MKFEFGSPSNVLFAHVSSRSRASSSVSLPHPASDESHSSRNCSKRLLRDVLPQRKPSPAASSLRRKVGVS